MTQSGTAAAQGFPAFPPSRRGGTFARSWWGAAWVCALEDTALDAGQLRRGKQLAKAGSVGPITVGPGLLSATVDDGEPQAARIIVRTFDDDTWAHLITRISDRAANLAALLDGELPRDLADSAADRGLDLVPALGDLESECSCDGWELACKHATAVGYQLSWLLDADPFLVLLLRGLGREDLLTTLRTAAPRESTGTPLRPFGIPAATAYSRFPRPLPRIPDIEPDSGPSAGDDTVDRVIESAARRARKVLNGSHDSRGGQHDVDVDTR